MKKNLFIVLEGLSGSGKSTLAKTLAEELDGVYYKTPSGIFLAAAGDIDMRADQMARFLFYLAGVVQSSVEIGDLLMQKSVVCDRYFLSTICYHRAMGLDVSIPKFISLVQPDLTLFIDCDVSIRLQRLHDRGMTHNDLQEQSSGLDARIFLEYRKFSLPVIDNAGDIAAALSAIRAHLPERG